MYEEGVSGGILRGVNVLNPGSNYSNPTATVTGFGSGASVQVLYSGITSITIIDGGADYVPGDATVTFIGGGGFGATAIPIVSPSSSIIAFTITNPGSGYTSAPTIIINQTIGTGSGFIGTVNISFGQVVGFNVLNGGSGYADTVRAAITITSSNVQLIFGSHRLSQKGVDQSGNVDPSQVPYVCGILIPDQPENPIQSVYISGDDENNGIIDGFSMFGIRVFANTDDIQLRNMTVKNVGKLAAIGYPVPIRPFQGYVPSFQLFPSGSTSGLLPAVPFTVGGIFIGEERGFGLGPIFFTDFDGVQNRVADLILQNVLSINNFYTALSIGNTSNIAVDKCHFDNTFCDDPDLTIVAVTLGGTLVDIDYPHAIVNLTFTNSTVNNTTQTTTDPTKIYNTPLLGVYSPLGVVFGRGTNATFENNQFNGTNTNFSGLLNFTSLLSFGNSAVTNSTWINCSFDNCSSLGCTQGFHISGHNYTGTDQVSNEADIFPAINCRLIKCSSSNNVCNGNLQLPQPVLYDDLANFTGSTCVGFASFYAKNLVFQDCVAMNNVSYCYATGICDAVQGFYLGGGGRVNLPGEFESMNTEFKNCKAMRARAVNGGNAYGILLQNYASFTLYNFETVSLDGCISAGNITQVPSGDFAESLGAQQGIGCGYVWQQELGAYTGYPVSYTNCKALNNKGVAILDNTASSDGFYYSAGFLAISIPTYVQFGGGPELVQGHVYHNCEATDNVYGFLFTGADRMVVRNCRSDLNVGNDGSTGEGFTDLGIDLRYDGTTVAGSTLDVINLDPLTASAIDGAYDGLFLQFTSGVNSVANVAYAFPILSYVGSPLFQATIGPGFFGTITLIAVPAANDHLYILGTNLGTPAFPLKSTSLFQANNAFANGAGYTSIGENGNYNILYDPVVGFPLGSVPTLSGSLSVSPYFPSSVNYVPVHNISITN